MLGPHDWITDGPSQPAQSSTELETENTDPVAHVSSLNETIAPSPYFRICSTPNTDAQT